MKYKRGELNIPQPPQQQQPSNNIPSTVRSSTPAPQPATVTNNGITQSQQHHNSVTTSIDGDQIPPDTGKKRSIVETAKNEPPSDELPSESSGSEVVIRDGSDDSGEKMGNGVVTET